MNERAIWPDAALIVEAVNSYDRLRAIEAAAQAMLAHHDRQNGVREGSPNDCEQARALRSALAPTSPEKPEEAK